MDETPGLGYEEVDDHPDPAMLLDMMDATARWDATVQLRAWERERLNLGPGQRVLEVGCGLGDAVLAFADDLGADGEIVGIDASEAMIAEARARGRSAGCRVRFAVGDALALGEPNDSFDVVRCERTLQWLADPAAAVAEMVRVLRPGGTLSLIDTDWSTFDLAVGDPALTRRVSDAVQTEQGRPSNVGGRLADLARSARLELAEVTSATQHWTDWDPDASLAPEGCFTMESLADDLVERGQLTGGDQARFVSTVHDAARAGRFSMRLTMFGVIARAG